MAEDTISRFLRQAERRPDHPAIVGGGQSRSYGELLRRVRAFAGRFSSFEQPRVVVALPQIGDAYAAILGTALAGGYHTPLNLAAPIEKMRRIIAVLQPDAIVANAALASQLIAEAPKAIVIDPAALDETVQFSGDRARHELAYIMFTSGSTGMPKGVMVLRSGLDHYVKWLETFEIEPADRVSQHPNLAFDISMTDIFGALCFGATLYPLVDPADRLMPARMIAREHITVWNSVPSVVSLMMQARQVTRTNLESVRLFNFCGEPLLTEHLQAIFAACPDVCVQNTYGPTEATISMTVEQLSANTYADACRSSVALGEPIPGMAIRLIGGNHAYEGEIVILGPQLARGYWQDAEKTAAVFRDVPTADSPRAAYFTGDWAERRDGKLYFKERVDFQVKVKGYRIELDEVASAIRHCGWPVVCVFKRDQELAAVVENVPGKGFDEAKLIAALSEKLEQYAIPGVIMEIDRMPRNENEKLDRRAAAAWFESRIAAH